MNLLEINATKLFELLHTDADKGLKSKDIAKNRAEFSSDVHTPKTLFAVIKNAFRDVMPWVLVFLTILSLSFNTFGVSWLALLIFTFAYASFKYASVRYSAKVSKLLNEVSTKAKVIRDGFEQVIDYSELVPGDILLLGLGDVVPCDCIVLWQDLLRVSEIQLTGNSSPVIKLMQEDVLRGKGVPYYECIIFAGSVVMSGDAKVLVCNTGKDVFDKKNKLTSRSKHARRTHIFEICSFISQQISLIWVLAAFFVAVVSIVRGINAFTSLYLSATLAVAALPDLVLTLFDLTLSVGTYRLYKKGCIIRDMSSLDRMCDISCVVVDDSRYFRNSSPRPNTVFVNDERKRFRGAGDSDVRELFELAVVASVGGDDGLSYNGISVERSLVKCAEELGITQASLYEKYLLLEKRPYSEFNGMSRVIVFKDHEFFVISIGSPSAVLKTCTYIENKGEIRLLDERERRSIRELSREIAVGNEGVAAIAIKKIDYKEGTGEIDVNSGYSFKGYIGLHTSIKADAARAVNICKKSGTDIVLMTSEGRSTSTGFAKSLSILREDDRIIEEKELVQMDVGVFRADIKKYKVYVSLDPDEKTDIVSYRKEDGDIIAVTASSVEDLRLIIEADVSFCPSSGADEAARQNADVILDGSFELIPECIKYARSVYRNTRHMLQYFLNFQFIMLFAAILPLLFTGIHSVTSGTVMIYSTLIALPLAFSLAVREPHGNELKDAFGGQNLEINIQNLILIPAICGFVEGAVITLFSKASQVAALSQQAANGCTFVILISAGITMAYALSLDDKFDFTILKNKYLIILSVLSLGIMALFVFVEPVGELINIAFPGGEKFALSFIMGFVPSLVCIGIKLVNKYVFSTQKTAVEKNKNI